ncbi:MAG: hypothetical protein JRF08_01450 [Deltaproteobacteria bacterium]|nr:hypothetical protein [Deltaproteobacteria bacterium]MBW2106654.1 hypothetical protein [Deltaproteobacteria bacterium]MBW2332150.1 hypothetical protein [Deltaproteobacteria bacterium]
MLNRDFVPDLKWYQAKSKSMSGTPRCPFAALRRCPKYYFSVWLMGELGGAAKINKREDEALLKYWQETDLWPIQREIEPGVIGSPRDSQIFRNICPEVAYERFGYFASTLSDYVDEIDRDCALKKLSERNADHNNWRWTWSGLVAQHYLDCPFYSQLLAGVKSLQSSAPKGKIGF